jgi:hypothetical protein|eukprot:COSAG06_NODE_736_length_12689_cov_11.840111_10_plen_54_part_00
MGGMDARSHGLSEDVTDSEVGGELVLVTETRPAMGDQGAAAGGGNGGGGGEWW